jgi:tRNA A37 N6-isopentenylltransferase MiaA
MQQQAQKKYSNLFTIDPQHQIPKTNPAKINEYLTGLLIDGFDSFIDGIHVTIRASFGKNNKKTLVNEVSILQAKTNEMVINIYHNDSYKVVVEKLDALTEYMQGKILYNKLRLIKSQNNWI